MNCPKSVKDHPTDGTKQCDFTRQPAKKALRNNLHGDLRNNAPSLRRLNIQLEIFDKIIIKCRSLD